jgi:hypothetical protein
MNPSIQARIKDKYMIVLTSLMSLGVLMVLFLQP